jgi:hypothetical protein
VQRGFASSVACSNHVRRGSVPARSLSLPTQALLSAVLSVRCTYSVAAGMRCGFPLRAVQRGFVGAVESCALGLGICGDRRRTT